MSGFRGSMAVGHVEHKTAHLTQPQPTSAGRSRDAY
jgi:hypothetical protein